MEKPKLLFREKFPLPNIKIRNPSKSPKQLRTITPVNSKYLQTRLLSSETPTCRTPIDYKPGKLNSENLNEKIITKAFTRPGPPQPR